MKLTELAGRIEHAVLAPDATEDDLIRAAAAARQWGVRALVVKPCYARRAVDLLAGANVKVVTVIGFPHGGQVTEVKVAETRRAAADGVEELDVVINIGALLQHQFAVVFRELRAIVEAAAGRPVKVILETGYLDESLLGTVSRLAARAGAAYVKTSTGFGPRGASEADVALMRRVVGRRVGVKAAGGVRSLADALRLIGAGADLIGTSHTEAILTEAAGQAAA